MDDSSLDNPLPRDEDRRQYVEHSFFAWCDDCDTKTLWVELDDGTSECQSCGGTV